MPNIEIHGLDEAKAREMRQKVFDAFADASFVKEMVVEIYLTDVEDYAGEKQPFFRLMNSHQEHNQEIIDKLLELGLDIEHPPELQAFYLKT